MQTSTSTKHFEYKFLSYIVLSFCVCIDKNHSDLRWIYHGITRKLINTNENTDVIFLSVNFRGILPMEIFPQYIPTELPWEKNLKQSKKKKMTCYFYQRNYRRNIPLVNSLGNFIGKLWILFIMSITKGITDGIFRRYFPESVIWRFSEKIQLI
jgi:hypothetical protein